ncbi:MAG: hypothetical protein ACJ8FY_08655 [Gemmataceae bacterium]
MQPATNLPRIAADVVGIHFLGSERDIVVNWGEIQSVDAALCDCTDGSTFLEIYIEHFSGVDFGFHNVEAEYEQVMEWMERQLIGFSRAKAEAAGTWDQKLGKPPVWTRDEAVQPFQLPPLVIDPREPTSEERERMEACHRASIATCEKILGRTLSSDEHACVHTGFENGRIVGSITAPLRHPLIQRESRE